MAKRVTTIKFRIQDDFVDFSFNIYIYIYTKIENECKMVVLLQ